MLWTAAVDSVHNHLTQTESSSCAVCVVAHSASPAPSRFDATPVFTAVGFWQEEEVLGKAQLDCVDLGVRGPPAV
jgi:hypothetical protein